MEEQVNGCCPKMKILIAAAVVRYTTFCPPPPPDPMLNVLTIWTLLALRSYTSSPIYGCVVRMGTRRAAGCLEGNEEEYVRQMFTTRRRRFVPRSVYALLLWPIFQPLPFISSLLQISTVMRRCSKY